MSLSDTLPLGVTTLQADGEHIVILAHEAQNGIIGIQLH
jgi:hypothetical protein